MAREGEVDEENVPVLPSTTTDDNRKVRRRPDLFLSLCRFFRLITAFAAILCIVANVLSAIRSFKNQSDVFDGIFRCYGVVIAGLVILAETEWSFIIKFSKVLEYWVGRGMLQIFVAVMTRAFPNYNRERQELVVLQNVACYMLLACGLLYVVLGILCIGILKRHRQKKEITREQAAKDLEETEQRREELERVLMAAE
uniref:Golgi apparatus membrane protein TVP15 n=1 Tax=Caragana jubata TaxID=283153 RepID=F8SVN5_9FABA|nr:unknown protein [Caragana jubata]